MTSPPPDDAPLVELTPLDPRYPSRLRSLPKPPACIATRGGSLEAEHLVAVVGSRECTPDAASFAESLARELATAGAVVVSGGAVGIDAAAHRGALAAGGRTWAVAATGPDGCTPPEHAGLFDAIGRGPGAMVWPFANGIPRFTARNRVLVALADVVVVVQAGLRSGALNAAGCARRLGKPLWVVPVPEWLGKDPETGKDLFAGSRSLLEQGARPLTTVAYFLGTLGLAPAPPAEPIRDLSESETVVLRATSSTPLHLDQIATGAGLPAQAAAAALLTLALENVVVEGPPGFYRRRNGR